MVGSRVTHGCIEHLVDLNISLIGGISIYKKKVIEFGSKHVSSKSYYAMTAKTLILKNWSNAIYSCFTLLCFTSTSHDREATGCDKIACNKTSILLQHLQCKMYSLKADYNTHYTFEQPWNVDCAQRTSIGLHSHHNTARCASALHSSQLPCSPIEAPKYTLPNWHYDFGDHWAWTTKQSDEISSYRVYKQFDSTVKPAYNNAGMPSNYHCCYQLLL